MGYLGSCKELTVRGKTFIEESIRPPMGSHKIPKPEMPKFMGYNSGNRLFQGIGRNCRIP